MVGRVSNQSYVINFLQSKAIIVEYCRSANCAKKVVAKILREAQREVKPKFSVKTPSILNR
jgi:hypothetical protein